MSAPVTLGNIGAYFLRLGATGFGGPAALAAAMQRDLVEGRGWLTRDEYMEGLAFSQMSPGPLAAQLAMYIGWLRGGVAGATVAAVTFVLPSFLMVWGLAAAYVRYNGLPWVQAAFYGVGAAVIGILARSAMRLAHVTMAKDVLLWGIAAALAVTTAVTGVEDVRLVLLGGLVTLLARSAGRAAVLLVPSAAGLATTAAASPPSLLTMGGFFAKAGVFVFGSGLAIVPFLHGGVVEQMHWLDERRFLDAVAVAMLTPGPVVIAAAFIGYLVRGAAGMTAAAAGVFLPVYLLVVAAVPLYRRHLGREPVRAFVRGVTAAAIGALGGAVVVLGHRAVTDGWTAAIALIAFALLLWRRVPEWLLVLVAAGVGLWVR